MRGSVRGRVRDTPGRPPESRLGAGPLRPARVTTPRAQSSFCRLSPARSRHPAMAASAGARRGVGRARALLLKGPAVSGREPAAFGGGASRAPRTVPAGTAGIPPRSPGTESAAGTPRFARDDRGGGAGAEARGPRDALEAASGTWRGTARGLRPRPLPERLPRGLLRRAGASCDLTSPAGDPASWRMVPRRAAGTSVFTRARTGRVAPSSPPVRRGTGLCSRPREGNSGVPGARGSGFGPRCPGRRAPPRPRGRLDAGGRFSLGRREALPDERALRSRPGSSVSCQCCSQPLRDAGLTRCPGPSGESALCS